MRPYQHAASSGATADPTGGHGVEASEARKSGINFVMSKLLHLERVVVKRQLLGRSVDLQPQIRHSIRVRRPKSARGNPGHCHAVCRSWRGQGGARPGDARGRIAQRQSKPKPMSQPPLPSPSRRRSCPCARPWPGPGAAAAGTPCGREHQRACGGHKTGESQIGARAGVRMRSHDRGK